MRRMDPAFQSFKKRVLERDAYTCRYCGFQAKKYQEVINLNNDYSNNRLSNMVTACCFCTQCFFLEAVGQDDYGGGVLIYLPDISQGDLNGLCHVLFCAIYSYTNYNVVAQDIYRNLRQRSRIVEQYLGTEMSDAALFGRMLMDVESKHRRKVDEEIVAPLRLLPMYSKFGKQLGEWFCAARDEISL